MAGAPDIRARAGRTGRWRIRRAGLAVLLSAAVAGCVDTDTSEPHRVVGGDPAAGQAIVKDYACGVCHVIPGVRGARGTVGPPLGDFAGRSYIAGRIPNRPELLTRWLLDPPALAPETAMPDVGLTEAEALDVAAYLYTLR